MSNTTSVFMVFGTSGRGNDGVYMMGVYPTLKLAKQRMDWLESDEGQDEWGFTEVFYDVVAVGPNGTNCEVSIL